MNRRDFLKGIAATVGVAALTGVAGVSEPAAENVSVAGDWVHIGIVQNGDVSTMYFDGKRVAKGLIWADEGGLWIRDMHA